MQSLTSTGFSASFHVVRRLRLTEVIAARHSGGIPDTKLLMCCGSTTQKVLLDYGYVLALT